MNALTAFVVVVVMLAVFVAVMSLLANLNQLEDDDDPVVGDLPRSPDHD